MRHGSANGNGVPEREAPHDAARNPPDAQLLGARLVHFARLAARMHLEQAADAERVRCARTLDLATLVGASS